jgi:hypothetical protein
LRQKTWQTNAKVLCAVPIHNDYRHPGFFSHDSAGFAAGILTL